MNRCLRIAFKGLAAGWLLLFLILTIGTSQNLALRFYRQGIAWELAWRDGRLWVDNRPQRRLEAERYAAAAERMAQANAEREDPARKVMKAEPWGSPAYRTALDELNRAREIAVAERSRQIAEQAAMVTASVEHSLPLGLLMGTTAFLPAAWITLVIIRFLRMPLPAPVRNERVRPRRLNLLAFAALVSVLLCVASAVLWVRSLLILDELVYFNRSPSRQSVTNTAVLALQGNVQFAYGHQEYRDRKIYEKFSTDSPGLKYVTPPFQATVGTRRPRQLILPWLSVERYPYLRAPSSTLSVVIVVVPLWTVILMTTIAPVFWVRRRVRIYRNAGHSLCRSCGYDLRFTPDRCPECGTIPIAVRKSF